MVKKLKNILRSSHYEIQITNRIKGCGRGRSPFVHGMLLPDLKQIQIKKDLDLTERTKTLIHELIHESYPNWVEELVEQTANNIYANLNERDKGFFMFFVQEESDLNYFLES